MQKLFFAWAIFAVSWLLFGLSDAAAQGQVERSAQMRANLAARAAAVLDDETPLEPVVPTASLLDNDPAYRSWIESVPAVRNFGVRDGSGRIRSIGGNPVSNSSVFAEVIVQISNDENVFCSGVVVGDNVVLTAAHCFCTISDKGTIVVGKSASAPEARRISMIGAKRYMPPEVRCGAGSNAVPSTIRGRDAGVIVLPQQLPDDIRRAAARVISGVRLADMGPRDELYIVGFGLRDERDSGSKGTKNFLLSPVVSARCERPRDARDYDCVSGEEMVAVDTHPVTGDGVGPCNADSGGAAFLVEEIGSGKVRLHLAGLVSRLVTSTASCGDGAIYTLLTPKRVTRLEEEAVSRGSARFRR